ncbi:MAG: hypothetical protein PHW12_00185 [Smithella sp.]|nr:hypothetical protein [Smithella sp.]
MLNIKNELYSLREKTLKIERLQKALDKAIFRLKEYAMFDKSTNARQRLGQYIEQINNIAEGNNE